VVNRVGVGAGAGGAVVVDRGIEKGRGGEGDK
jgi:hypothetical protein